MPDELGSLVFVDTNVWLYAFIETGESEKTAMARALIQECQPVVSAQVINEICVNLIKTADFDEPRISQLIASFFENMRWLTWIRQS